ncbi:hypothetical protein B0H63DRAFT_464132 [Podospora didyma]|uniref:Uncharacterized protein n=1 Tax=Podospora didyma TaxID=330526 RepID=A0AAE0NXK7_9PEZI|nr:hypothetical protein B0H63DRAFT_464132 [Podospora didyma]
MPRFRKRQPRRDPPPPVSRHRWTASEGQETRMSPWGLQARRSEVLWVPTYRISYDDEHVNNFRGDGKWEGSVRGRWLKDVRRPNWGWSYALSWPLINAFVQSDTIIDPALDLADTSGDDYPPPPSTEQKIPGRCLIEELPIEVLRPILEYLIPTGYVYMFMQGVRHRPERDGGPKVVTIVQQMIPLSGRHKTATSAHVALAAASRAWNEIIYDMFFGQNQFIFDISNVIRPIAVNFTHAQYASWESWSRTYPLSSGPLGPLTSRAARHLQDVMLLLAEPEIKRDYPTKFIPPPRRGLLKPLVSSAIDLLMAKRGGEDGQKSRRLLKRLRVEVEGLYYLGPDKDLLHDGYDPSNINASVCEETGRMQTYFSIPRKEFLNYPLVKSEIQRHLEKLLLRLRGCDHVNIDGDITDLFADRFQKTAVLDVGEVLDDDSFFEVDDDSEDELEWDIMGEELRVAEEEPDTGRYGLRSAKRQKQG